MAERALARRLLDGAAVAVFAGLVAACTTSSPTPAPVVLKGEGDVFREAPVVMAPGRAAPLLGHRSEARQIVVRPGQSVGGLAQEYHVQKKAIIAANHLAPPYKIETGQRLIIPGTAERPLETAGTAAPARLGAGRPMPEIIPLDGPPPAKSPDKPAPVAPPGPSSGVSAGGPSAAAEARPEPDARAPALPHGGQLPWPVRGHVLAGYGVGAGGRHNDGINIAAPRGAPVKAVDTGVVAYAGNELRGYGNLVLVKHPDGFISAYAHCDELLVKRGDKVTRGEVIAKVGATGGVSEPQLHFELRRGERAVDPRQFLTPAPSAASARSPQDS